MKISKSVKNKHREVQNELAKLHNLIKMSGLNYSHSRDENENK